MASHASPIPWKAGALGNLVPSPHQRKMSAIAKADLPGIALLRIGASAREIVPLVPLEETAVVAASALLAHDDLSFR